MVVSHDAILVLYGVAALVGIAVGGVVLRHREKAGATPLALVLFGSVFLSGPRAIATASDSFAVSVAMERLLYVGVGISIIAGVWLVLEYTGREHLVTRRTLAVLSIEPILAVGFAVFNPRNLFFDSLEPDASVPTGVAVDWGVAFGVHTAYSYLLMGAITLLILEFLYTSRALYRGQAAALLGAAILPWIANAVHVVGPVAADTTPIGYILLGTLYAVAIVRYQLIDIVPVARDRVLDTVTEGVFVIDQHDRIVDVNAAGRAIVDADGATEGELIGRHIESVFADEPSVIDRFRALTETRTTAAAELDYGDRHYEVQVTPVTDGRDRQVGRLALVYDITDRKRREATLKRHNERLDQFASLVSHDLRNPLTVADGYLELARENDLESEDDVDQYLSEVARAHERMEAIIDDVLLLAREGETVTDPESVSLEDLAERAWATVDTDDASLTVDGDPTIRADSDRCQRLLENLFRNAVEHGSTFGESLSVTVGPIGDADGSAVTDGIDGFYVEDDGVGIPADERDRIFEGGYSTTDGGTGFGLQIVQQIADAHGWTVTVTESGTGGARFEFGEVEYRGADDCGDDADGNRDDSSPTTDATTGALESSTPSDRR